MPSYLELDFSATCPPGPHGASQSLELWQQAARHLQQQSFSILAEQGQADDQFQIQLTLTGLDQALNLQPLPPSLLRLRIDAVQLASPNPAKALERAAGVVLQQLYLALNLSLPGAGHLLACHSPHQTSFYNLPGFNASLLESAWQLSQDWQWPVLQQLDFAQVWQWLDQQGLSRIDIATTPLQKACFCLLELAEAKSSWVQNVLPIGHLLELFTATDAANFGLCEQRLQLVLGSAGRHRHALQKFDELRQDLRLGQRPLLRPADLAHQQVQDLHPHHQPPASVSAATAVLLAILQQLVQQRSSGLKFSESYQFNAAH